MTSKINRIMLKGGELVTTIAAGSATLETTDYVVFKTAITGGGDTLTLPVTGLDEGAVYKIYDTGGTASTDNITIDPTGATTINGAASVAINTDYGFVTCIWDGTQWLAEVSTGGGGGATNLSIGTTTATALDINSSTGTNATIPQAIATTAAGLLSGADKAKLDGIATGAEVNTVDSVNAQTGAVVLDPDDLDDTLTTNKFTTAGDISKLAGIEAGADVTDATNVEAAGAVMESDFTPAFGILAQQAGTGSPSIATIGVDEIVGRKTGGGTNIEGLTASDVRTIINVENGADVTDATNVNAAGAVMESDTTTASMSFVIDEDDMATDSATKLPTQQSVKAYVDGKIDSGTSFPGTPAEGQRFYRTDLECWFYYDSSRSKWLGDNLYEYQGSVLGTTTNGYSFLDDPGIRYTSVVGHLAIYDLCIVEGYFLVAASSTCTAQLRDDGTSVATISVSAATTATSTTLNSATIAAGSSIGTYISGTATGGHVCTFYARRVAT